MKDVKISQEAQLALVKLLAKLGLVSEVIAEQPWSDHDYCPVAHFARRGQFREEEALAALAEVLHLPVFTLDRRQTAPVLKAMDHKWVSGLAPELWRQLRCLPVKASDQQITLAMANPLDHHTLKSLEFQIGCRITVIIAKEEDILALLGQKNNSSYTIDLGSLVDEAPAASNSHEETSHLESNIIQDDVSAAPVVRLVNKILSDGVRALASDIHLNPEKDNLSVKVRVDGVMRPLFAIPAALKNPVTSRLKLLAGMDIAERRKPQDGRLRIKTEMGIKDLRLSTIPTLYGENLVIRILAADLNKITFEALGFTPSMRDELVLTLGNSSQVLLSTGPTGSGKTSTLYACLLHLRDGTTNIVTIEDPIEYRIQGINQIQVNPKLDVTFAQGLRSVLRQDPDVIMVGEIRDYETGSIAMQAAQTGHLVLSTLHTNTAAAAITRLRDLKIPSYLIASSLGTVVAQRLVRKLCPHCAVPLKGIDLVPYRCLGLVPEKMQAAAGCAECSDTGFRGRRGIFSILRITDPVREAIREELGEKEIERRARSGGFRTLAEEGIALLNNGESCIDELERALGPLELLMENIPHTPTGSNPITRRISALGPVSAGSFPLPRRRVLLVDDDENTRVVLSLLLQREMLEVEEAQDGFEALEKIYRNPPQIIICDLMMPRMSGFEMLKQLRHDSRIRSIPVLMLTAADSESNEIQVIDSGADDFVSKTADSKVMLARIHRLLERASNNT